MSGVRGAHYSSPRRLTGFRIAKDLLITAPHVLAGEPLFTHERLSPLHVIDGQHRLGGILRVTSMLSVGVDMQRLYREASLTNYLLNTAEKATGLPSAVVSLVPGVPALRPGMEQVPSEDQIAEIVNRLRQVAHLALAALGVLLGLTHYAVAWCPPPGEASPCGVIGLASPIVPGAPQSACVPTPRTYTLAA